ncbi:NHL repeat-containing protein [Kineosporia sp. R_H_3]|uniref:NHL repeat-containing protein n=1 Tax=Kineosporia sp. R_H_3 TaxID=1961848 RepID=UPI000B4A97C9|nr:NHL repeat-containing protein [Kineosporia sp. R_H_3]
MTLSLSALSGTSAVFSGVTDAGVSSFTVGYFAFDTAVISTWAGTGVSGYAGDGGIATSAKFLQPSQIAVDAGGNLYVADISNNRVRKITAAGVISTIAGTGAAGYSGDGGAATSAQLDAPRGVALDAAGALYITDGGNHRIRKVSPAGTITTVAGNGTAGFSGDGGPASAAMVNLPRGIASDTSHDVVYFVDSLNFRVRKIDASGSISTVAGVGTSGFSGDGGPATAAQISESYDLTLGGSGCLYLPDTGNHRLRTFCPGGTISTVAGSGLAGSTGDGGPAISARLNGPSGAAVDSAGVIYLADRYNNRLRKITPAGVITTVTGNGAASSTGDGGPASSATVYGPRSIVLYGTYLYLVEQDGQRVRRLA